MQTPAPSDLLRAYNAQVHLFRSLHLVGTLRSSSTGTSSKTEKHKDLAAIIDLLQPDMLRIDGVVPFSGSRVVELTSDGKNFGLLVPGDKNKVFFAGPVNAPARSQNAWENLRAGQFLPALRWEEGTMEVQAHQTAAGSAALSLMIDVPGDGYTMPHKVRVQFDLQLGVVNGLTLYDPADSPVFEAHYSDWKTARGSSGDTPQGCYPRHILIADTPHGYQVEIHLDDVTLNMDMPRSFFRPTPPRGVQIKRLDAGDR